MTFFLPRTDVFADQTAAENDCKPEEASNMTEISITKSQLLSRTLTIKDSAKGSASNSSIRSN